MTHLLTVPTLVFFTTFLLLWLAAHLGMHFRSRHQARTPEATADLDTIVTATLTLLGLIIGFSFSMAITRYDQRKNLEEEEANAIGTEYLRAELLPAPDAARTQALLARYLDQRILYYLSEDRDALTRITATTGQLQTALWQSVRAPALAQATSPLVALAVSGMNDVLNSQGYTEAAWANRIPVAAWGLLAVVALFSNLLIGFGMHGPRAPRSMLLVLPLIVAIAFFFIADIDSPRGGAIRIHPRNLLVLAHSLATPASVR